jgi:O-antigen ligase
VLLPMFMRSFKKNDAFAKPDPRITPPSAPLRAADWMLIAYAGLQMMLFYRLDSVSIWMRQSFLVFIDLVLPYFAIRRSVRSLKDIEDLMASFVTAMVVLSLLAVFETLKHWLLFAHVEDLWNALGHPVLLLRGDTLRAQVTAGHSIVMGNAFAMAIGLALYLRSRVPGTWFSGLRLLGTLAILALVAGLAATVARGPWLGAVIIFIVFNAVGPNAVARFSKAAILLTVLLTALVMSPWGESFVNLLPFIGNDPDGAVGYRQRLAEVSWNLILSNPVFGSVDYRAQMESMRNGEGIIDIVNAYAGIGLNSGFTGLLLFLGFFGAVLGPCLRAVLQSRRTDSSLALMGGCLFACVAASLVILTTVNLYISINSLVWALAGVAVAYTELVLQQAAQRTAPAATGVLSRGTARGAAR